MTLLWSRMCFLVSFLRKMGFELFKPQSRGFPLLLQAFLNSDSHGNGHADHGVVACAQEAHHFHVGGDGGGTCELSVTVHTAHGVGHAVGSGACSHVVGVQGTAGAAAGSDGEVLLAGLHALLLVGAGNGMLEAGGVGGVTGNGNVNTLVTHNSNAFTDVVTAVAVNGSTLAIGVRKGRGAESWHLPRRGLVRKEHIRH